MNIRKILREANGWSEIPSGLLLSVTEAASMGLLTGAVALWAVALWPLH